MIFNKHTETDKAKRDTIVLFNQNRLFQTVYQSSLKVGVGEQVTFTDTLLKDTELQTTRELKTVMKDRDHWRGNCRIGTGWNPTEVR